MAEIINFDPDSVGSKENNIFGLPFNAQNAQLILLPVPWEVTTSYRAGTADGPNAIFDASYQVDLYDADFPNVWQKGFFMESENEHLQHLNKKLRPKAERIINSYYEGKNIENSPELLLDLNEINRGCKEMNHWVYESSLKLLQLGKKVALIGGDHSTPLGFLKALGHLYKDFAVLQIDAHADLRIQFEGFTYSHASVMYNVLQEIPEVTKLVQVGIRDYGFGELDYIKANPNKIVTFFDRDLKMKQYDGANWSELCRQIVETLPENVFISFDIDGLDPKLCPNTGTPVPGGFELEQVFHLFRTISQQGKKVIGFDLNEVSTGGHNDAIDAITGARLLYKLCNLLAY